MAAVAQRLQLLGQLRPPGLMQVAQKVIANPQLDMQIAQTQHKLGDKQAALTTLHAILATNPEFEPAKALVKTLTL